MGFLLKKLRVTGASVDHAEVQFTNGLNVITGPSDTGKSYIFQCINYMLGSKNAPKLIQQAKPYDKLFLEIETFDGKTFTIESALKGGNFKIYEQSVDSLTSNSSGKKISRKHSSKNEDNISAFFLRLTNLNNVRLRINAKGGKSDVSYRDVSKFLLIDETNIITDKSPIVGDDYISSTKQKSLLKFLLTGKDDSSVIEGLTKDQIKNRKGKVELLDELILDLNSKLLERPEQFEKSLDEISRQIESLTENLSNLRSLFSDLDTQKNILADSLAEKRSEEQYYHEILFRSRILKEQYLSDINRLKATIEASLLLVSGHTLNGLCPLCKSDITNKCSDTDIAQIIESCEYEMNKIESLYSEVFQSERAIEDVLDVLNKSVYSLQNEMNEVVHKMENDLVVRMSKIVETINLANDKKIQYYQAKYVSDSLQNLVKQKSVLENYDAENISFEEVSTSLMISLCDEMREVLQGCNYPSLSSVIFSEKKTDFVISGQDRDLSGKGFRAITYSAFIIALQELLYKNKRFIGVPVLDSPLVTYKPNSDNNEGVIPHNLAMDFYRYVAKSKKIKQLIILENEVPPTDVEGLINHIKFTKSDTAGRYGFFPADIE